MELQKYNENIHPDEWINDLKIYYDKVFGLKYHTVKSLVDPTITIPTEINDIKEQKKYLYKSLPISNFYYYSNKFHGRMKNVNSINELIKEFEEIILEESNLIRNESIVALKHVASGKYLRSISNLHYTTGSKTQLVYFYIVIF